MPREIYTIGVFDKGVVYAADNQDIDQDSATYQTDVWANTDDGKLIGRPTDTAVQSTIPAYYAESYAWLQRGSMQDLFYYNGNGQSIDIIQDFYGTPLSSSLGNTGASESPSFIPLNKEVHIGLGNASTTPPKWAGYATEGQFGSPAPTDPFIVDAECKVEGTVPYLYKIHVETVDAEPTIFGIAQDGQYLYKIVISTGVVTRTDTGVLKHTYAMCPDATAGFAWVYDKDSAMGTLYRINLSTLAVQRSHTIATHATPAYQNYYTHTLVTLVDGSPYPVYISDMAVTTANGGTIWLAYYAPSGCAYMLWKATIIGSGEMTFTNATPALVGGTVQDGQFSVWDGASTFYAPNRGVVETYYERSLTVLDTTTVGWLVKVFNAVGSFDYSSPGGGGSARTGPYYERTGSVHQIVNHIIFAIPDTMTAGTGVGVYEVNTATGTVLYNGIHYTPTGYKMHLSSGTTLYQYSAGSTIPAAGGWIDATTVVTKTFTYPISVSSQLSTDVYLTRTATKVGIDKVDTGLSAITEVYSGANVYLNSPANNATTGVFTASRTYFYRLAFEYDGYQMSVLSPAVSSVDNDSSTTTGKDVPIVVADISVLNPRVTAIYLFRASGPYLAASPDNLYRVVERISVNDSRWGYTGDAASLTINDNVEVVGVTYEAVSGCAETLDSNIVHYKVSAATNGILYVGNCYHPEIEDAEQYIFASKPGRYDVFNWIVDYLRLPFIPIALVSYAGRLWAFSHNRIARIAPNGLVLEDIYEGAGIDHPRSVAVTEQGMFFANRNNVYWHNGQTLEQIGNPILDRTDAGPGSLTDYSYRYIWSYLHSGKYMDVVYSSKHQYLFVFMRLSNDELYAWGYHITKRRWDFFTFPLLVDATTVPYGYSILGFKGEVYYSETNTVYRLFDITATRTAWTWVSNRFTAGDPNQLKKFYEVQAISSGTAPTITYSVDEGTYTALTGTNVAVGDRQKKSIRLKVVGAASTSVNAISVIFRRMIGKR